MLLGLAPALAALVPAAALAWLLRKAGCPGGSRGAAIAAGIACGLLLSAGVFGRLAPALHTDLFVGGREQAARLAGVAPAIEAERAALAATNVSPEAIEEHERRSLRPRLEEARAQVRLARDAFARQLDLWASFIAGGYAALTLASGVTRSSRLWRRTGERAIDARWRDAARGALSALLAASVPALAAWSLLGSVRLALGVAAAFAVPGLVALPSSVFIASAVGLALAGSAAVVGLWTWPATVLVVTAIVGLALGVGRERPADRPGTRSGSFPDALLLPGLVALTLASMDPHALGGSGLFIWTAVLAVLWSSDGRWMAARVAGFTWRYANLPVSHGASGAQVVFAAACGWAGVPDGAVAAILLGALVIELSSSIRAVLADRFDGSPAVPAAAPPPNDPDA